MKAAVVLMLLVTVAIAAPSKAEVDAFQKQMGATLDEVAGYEQKAEAAEKAGKLDEAERFWLGLWRGAEQVRQHALRAAAAGMFQDPMKFPTKAGTLSATQYRRKLDALIAKGDARHAKAALALANAEAKQRKQTYVQGVAANVAALEKLLARSRRAGKSEAVSARAALTNLERGARSLAQSVRDAEKQGRAPKGASYPVTPKPLASAALVAHLGKVATDAKAALAELEKKYPPPPPAKVTARTAQAPRATPPAGTSPRASAPVAAAPPPEPVCETGQINCDNGMVTCCPGERCSAAGYIVYSDHFEADYYQCMDPAFAPSPPVM